MVLYVIIFLFGLAVGSFLNCVIYRLETGGSFLRGRSYCPHCKHILSWPDLIPVLSFLILGGKCRYCKKPISFQYPLVELATGILFVLIFWHLGFGFDLTFGFWILISCFLIIIFVYDLKYFIIPDKIIYPAVLIVLIFRILNLFGRHPPATLWKLEIGDFKALADPIFAGFGAGAFFLLIVISSKGRWMGWGDVKLVFLMGLLLGFPNILVALFLAFLIGAIIGIGLILAKLKSLKSEVPFGPFLVTGTFIALFWAEKIIQWYLDLFILTS